MSKAKRIEKLYERLEQLCYVSEYELDADEIESILDELDILDPLPMDPAELDVEAAWQRFKERYHIL